MSLLGSTPLGNAPVECIGVEIAIGIQIEGFDFDSDPDFDYAQWITLEGGSPVFSPRIAVALLPAACSPGGNMVPGPGVDAHRSYQPTREYE
jgi:hypothetical protein